MTTATASKPTVVLEERDLYWFKENLEAVVVAYLMALFIRCFFIEVFQIPTGSMEPTLSGNAYEDNEKEVGLIASGDRIMATKYFPGLRGIRRYDVVIFRFPLNDSRVFIKRVVGLPGEELALLQGNLYARPAGSTGPFLIQRKPLSKQEGLWVPTIQKQDDHPWPPENLLTAPKLPDQWTLHLNDRRVSLARGRLEIDAGPDESLAFSPLDLTRSDEGTFVDDMLLETAMTAQGGSGSFSLSIQNIYGSFVLETTPDKGGSLAWTPSVGPVIYKPLPEAVLKRGTEHRLRLMVYDGLCRAEMDGRLLAEIEFLGPARQAGETPADAEELIAAGTLQPRPLVTVRGLPVTLTDLRHVRDIHYQGRMNIVESIDQATTVPADHYVLMGDNTKGSHDSRLWREHRLKLRDGRVIVCEDLELKPLEPERSHTQTFKVVADLHGNAHTFSRADLVGPPPRAGDGTPLIFVRRDYIIGTALWAWLPKTGGRGIRMIH